MQISSLNPALFSPSASADDDLAGRLARDVRKESTAAQAAAAPAGETERNAGAADTVSVSTRALTLQTGGARELPAPTYAEIWKDGMKLADVDIHGHVTSYSGLVPAGDGGSGGALLAAQRAVQLAQITGGEIRAAGQAIDGKTLLMRARLVNAYSG